MRKNKLLLLLSIFLLVGCQLVTPPNKPTTSNTTGNISSPNNSSASSNVSSNVPSTSIISSSVLDIKEIKLNKNSLNLAMYETYNLTYTTSPSITESINLNWVSSNLDVVNVENGLVTALKDGKSTITCYANNTVYDSCEVTVYKDKLYETNFVSSGASDFITEGAEYNGDYFKLSQLNDKINSPIINQKSSNITIEISYKVTKNQTNNEPFEVSIYGKANDTVLDTIILDESNTVYSSGDNIQTITLPFENIKDSAIIETLTFELTKKKTGSTFWLYGFKIFEHVYHNYDDISFHFMELGNANAGDSIYIKAGDVDILIDAGSLASSAANITKYVDQYCTDNTLEYVVATHADEDHISGFVGTSTAPGIFDYYICENIIDFSLTNKTTIVYNNYISERNAEIGNGAKHYPAQYCIENDPIFEIANGITMTVLNQKFYREKSSDENNYSVCLLFSQGENHFLFTGDLEEKGEESLVELNDLPHVKLFKAGHHGSKTSSNDELLNAITPEVCCVCCCAGNDEYSRVADNMFPTQEFINRIAKHTTKVYVPTQLNSFTIATSSSTTKGVQKGEQYIDANGYKSMNGNIIVTTIDGEVKVTCSVSDVKLKDSTWFNTTVTLNGFTRKVRTWPNINSTYN